MVKSCWYYDRKRKSSEIEKNGNFRNDRGTQVIDYDFNFGMNDEQEGGGW